MPPPWRLPIEPFSTCAIELPLACTLKPVQATRHRKVRPVKTKSKEDPGLVNIAEFERTSESLPQTLTRWWRVLTPVAGALGTGLATLQIEPGLAKSVAWVVTLSLIALGIISAHYLRRARKAEAERELGVKEYQIARAARS